MKLCSRVAKRDRRAIIGGGKGRTTVYGHFSVTQRSCRAMRGSLTVSSRASSIVLDTTSAVRGPSSRNGKKTRSRCWLCTGTIGSDGGAYDRSDSAQVAPPEPDQPGEGEAGRNS